MYKEPFKIKCRNCRNAVIESALEGKGQLVTRYKKLQRVAGMVYVQCNRCGAWIKIRMA